MSRRRAGTLVGLEAEILAVLLAHREPVHGFELARLLSGDRGGLTAHGTLYKALGRMTSAGLLADEWEAEESARREGRPRRRYYRITGEGRLALAQHRAEEPRSASTAPGAPGEVSPA